MPATWDVNAHQLQNDDFLVIKSSRNEGVVWDALPSHPGKIMLCYNSIQPSGNALPLCFQNQSMSALSISSDNPEKTGD